MKVPGGIVHDNTKMERDHQVLLILAAVGRVVVFLRTWDRLVIIVSEMRYSEEIALN